MHQSLITKILELETCNPRDQAWYAREWESIEKYPLFISFPRTGSHWINCVMELYFDRPRLPAIRATFLPLDRKDWLYFHDHDTIAYDKLWIQNIDALYMYRDPIDTIFSYLIYQFNNGRSLQEMPKDELELLITASSYHYRNHLQKWIINSKAKTIIKYENFKKDPIKEFSKISEHFSFIVDVYHIESCFSVVTPKEISKRKTEPNTLSDFMLTTQYTKERQRFKEDYASLINDIVITLELREWF